MDVRVDDGSGVFGRWGGRVVLVLVGVLAPLIGLELGLRLVGFEHARLRPPVLVWNAERDSDMRAGLDLHEAWPSGLWRPRANAAIPDVPGETTNELGLRGPSPDAATGTVLVSLGDSSTFGWETPWAETYSGRLESELGDDHAVLGGGVIGYTLVQGRARYVDLVRTLEPSVAILAFGAVNEHFPSDVGGDQERIELLLERDSKLDQLVESLHGVSRLMQGIAYLAEQARGGREALMASWTESKLSFDRDFERRGELDFPGHRRVEVVEFERGLRGFVDELRADGVAPILVSMPRRLEFEQGKPILERYTDAVERVAEGTGVPLVDARAAFRADPRGEDALLIDTVHPTSSGHALICDLLLPTVRAALGSAPEAGDTGSPLSPGADGR